MKEYSSIYENIELPLSKGDEITFGKFKNKSATVTGVTTGDLNQPEIETDRGNIKLGFRIKKLMPSKNESMIKSYKRVFSEFSIEDFRKQGTAFTRRFRRERDVLRGKESKTAVVVNVKKKGNDLFIYFLTLPTHADNAEEVPSVKTYPPTFKETNSYTIVVKVIDFFKWKTKPFAQMTVGDLKEIFKVADVQFHNTSPAFFLQGYAANLTDINSSIYPVTVPATRWNPITDKGILDKHLLGLVNSFNVYIPEILNQLRMKTKVSKHYQK